jgi:hypothetical protein
MQVPFPHVRQSPVSAMPRFAPLLIGLLAVALLTTACASNNETKPSPTAAPASPTVAATAMTEEQGAAEALLKAVTLGAEDLPEGYTLVDEGFTTNEEAAGEEGSSAALTVEDLDSLGRILGYEAVYSREASSGTLLLLLTTEVYRDSAGARESFDLLRQQPSDAEIFAALQENLSGSDLDIQTASLYPISFAEVGDDRLAFELRTNVNIPDLNTNVDQFTQFVDIQRGRGIGSIAAVALGSRPSTEELEDLARTLDERMKDALE